MGAHHDPSEAGRCSPGGDNGNFVMYPGSIGSSHVRSEFSQCSNKEIGRTLEQTNHSCLITWEQVNNVNLDIEARIWDPRVTL